MTIWRVCRAHWAATAFSGVGGLYSHGRWHHIGHRIVYTSDSLALASSEAWVHVNGPHNAISNYVYIRAEIPDDVPIQQIDDSCYPREWVKKDPPEEQRQFGTTWLTLGATAVLRVPTVTNPEDFNYLINPLHSDFAKIRIGSPTPFTFDIRMWKTH